MEKLDLEALYNLLDGHYISVSCIELGITGIAGYAQYKNNALYIYHQHDDSKYLRYVCNVTLNKDANIELEYKNNTLVAIKSGFFPTLLIGCNTLNLPKKDKSFFNT
jgi:hypothetical protein